MTLQSSNRISIRTDYWKTLIGEQRADNARRLSCSWTTAKQNVKENTVSENSNTGLNETNASESKEIKDEVRDTKVNIATEQSSENQSTEITSEQESDSDSKQDKTNIEEAKS